MAQRLKTCHNNLNSDVVLCDKYISRILSKEKPNTVQRCRDKNTRQSNANQMSKLKPNVKQQNVPSPKHGQVPNNLFQYKDDSQLLEIPMKTTNLRQRSRSTTLDRGTWGQLLNQQKSGDKISVFGNFDPLRTLHFLAKELQYQLQVLLPDETTVQQMLADIQHALKRVPPEVASTVHLQQALLFPYSQKNSSSDVEKPVKPATIVCTKSTQTESSTDVEEKLNKMMQSTLKFEESCKKMEEVCNELKKERDYLTKQLEIERDNATQLRIRIHDLEIENTDILTPKIKALEEEKQKLETNFAKTAKNLESEALATTTDLKAQLAEAKNSKMLVDQECVKLRHQLKLTALEKEKFVAILSVRDKQISEIRNEMTQLQDVVNEQLLELHASAFKTRPGGENGTIDHHMLGVYDKENIGDATISTIYSKEDNGQQQLYMPKSNHSFRDIPAGDLDYSSVLPEYQGSDNVKNGVFSRKDHQERSDSQASIRNMFSEVKRTAYSVANTPRERSQYNLQGNR